MFKNQGKGAVVYVAAKTCESTEHIVLYPALKLQRILRTQRTSNFNVVANIGMVCDEAKKRMLFRP